MLPLHCVFQRRPPPPKPPLSYWRLKVKWPAATAELGSTGLRSRGGGLQVEARLTKQRPGTMRAVIAPKAAAVENFAIGSGGRAPLAFSLLCSSVSAVAGYNGQVPSPPRSPSKSLGALHHNSLLPECVVTFRHPAPPRPPRLPSHNFGNFQNLHLAR